MRKRMARRIKMRINRKKMMKTIKQRMIMIITRVFRGTRELL